MTRTFAKLACLVLVFSAAGVCGASAQAVGHPLDALTAAEYWAVFDVMKASGKLDEKSRYASVNLQEPPKAEVLTWKKGDPITRHALAVITQGADTFEAVIDINNRKFSSWRKVEDAQANITREGFGVIEDLVKGNPAWQAAMKRRGIVDYETIECFGGELGYFDTAPERGRHLVRAICTDRRGAWSGQFRPIEGVIALIDWDKRQVIDVIDTGVRPVPRESGDVDSDPTGRAREVPGPFLVQQPLGPGFELDGQEVRWQNWLFHFRVDPKVGTVVSLVRYNDAGRERSVMYQGLLSEIFVPYMDPGEGWYFMNFIDLGETPIGKASPLERGTDCPEHAAFFDATFVNERGIPERRRRATCLFERESGDMAWRHFDHPDHVESRARRDLVLRQIQTIGNYDYLVDWVFQQDGAIKVVAGATGQVNVKAVSSETSEQTASLSSDMNGHGHGSTLKGAADRERADAYGRFIAPNTVAVNHDHFLSFRLDLDVDGAENTFVVDRLVSRTLPAGQPRRSIWTVESAPVRSEAEGKLTAHEPVLWRVINPGKHGRMGYPVSYQLRPGHSATSLLAPDDNPQLRGGFSQYQLWVTHQNDAERFAAGPYTTGARKADGLPLWTEANRPLEDADLVLWYTMGMHHVVRAEDWPIMPVVWHELEIRPFDFFSRNPALDLPRRP